MSTKVSVSGVHNFDKNQRRLLFLLFPTMILSILGSTAKVSAQEADATPLSAAEASTMESEAHQPRFADRASVDRIERRGRWMLSWGAASLGLGAGLIAGAGAGFALAGSDVFPAWALMTGGVLLVTGAVLTPLGVKRKRWARSHKGREMELALAGAGMSLRGRF